VFALQRLAGNRAVGQLLAREVTSTIAGHYVRLVVGSDVSLPLVAMAWTRTAHGSLDDAALSQLHDVALAGDKTVDDNERLFLAALLDAANASRWHTDDVPQAGSVIVFSADSITAANRRRVQDVGRTAHTQRTWPTESGDPAEHAARLDADIMYLAGAFAQVARDTIALADERKLSHLAIYYAMLNGASDSTEGDRAFAGAVYVIARREGLDDAAERIIKGTVKVDEVSRSLLPHQAEGMYMAEASAGGFKGDTLYLPSEIKFSSLVAQGTVVHELTHAGQEADATSLRSPTVEDSEFEAFLAEAGTMVWGVMRRTGADRERAVEDVARQIPLVTLLCMLISATTVLDDTKAVAAVREIHAKVQQVGQPTVALGLSETDLTKFIAGLEDEQRHDQFSDALEKRARHEIDKLYRGIDPARERGYVGESQLDTLAADAPAAKAATPTPAR
jgi:hypothetical protein